MSNINTKGVESFGIIIAGLLLTVINVWKKTAVAEDASSVTEISNKKELVPKKQKQEVPLKNSEPTNPVSPELTISKIVDGYTNKFLDFNFLNGTWEEDALQIVSRIFENKERYVAAAAQLNKVPWYVIAIIHYLEGNLSFSKHLHNGDSLKKRTVRVPSGRPIAEPANGIEYSWEESAIDAIKQKNWHKWNDWSVKDVLFRLENYNGTGYRNMGKLSPYIWSGSNYGIGTGKYVSDGKYSPTATSEQVGAALLLKKILEKLGYTFETTSNTKIIVTEKDEFSKKESLLKEWFDKQNIKYFSPKEFLTLGGGNENGKCQGKNSLPPDDLLENISKVAKQWDIVRNVYNKPIVVNSVYRSPEYNKCLDGTASNSFHMKGMAADCSPENGDMAEFTSVIKKLKANGNIEGGWGVYPTFVHLDVRGYNVKFR